MSKKMIRFDWAIKRLLRNKANFVVLEGFLRELLFDNVKIEKFLDNAENLGGNSNSVDVLVRNATNEFIIVKFQSIYKEFVFEEIIPQVSQTIFKYQFDSDFNFKVKKVISINIIYFDPELGEDYIYKGQSKFEVQNQNDKPTDDDVFEQNRIQGKVSNIFPEYYLLILSNFSDKVENTLDEWIYFFKNSEVKDEFSAKGLKEAGEVLDIMRLTSEDQYGYNRYLDSLHLKASEIFSLQTEAEFKIKEEIALKLIKSGVNYEIVASATNLTLAQIEALREKL